jgi:hypothetical protein
MTYATRASQTELTKLLRRRPDPAELALVQTAPHEIAFTLDSGDLVHAVLRWITKDYLTRTGRGLLIMAAVTGLLLTMVVSIIAQSLPLAILGAAISSVPLILAMFIHKRRVRERFASTPALASPRAVIIGLEGVTETFVDGERAFPWSAITDAVIDKRQLALRAGREEIIVPRRAFLGSGHLEGFLVLISAYRHGMRGEGDESWPPRPR